MPLIMFVSSSFNTYINLPKKSTCFQTNSASSSSTWRPNLNREGVVQPKPYAKAEPPNTKKDAHAD
jgi:hypothetical protein